MIDKSALEIFEIFLDDNSHKAGYEKFIHPDGNYIPISEIHAEFDAWCSKLGVSAKVYTNRKFKHTMVLYYVKWLKDYKLYLSEKLSKCPISNNQTEWKKLQKLTEFTDNDIIIYKALIWKIKTQLITNKQIKIQFPMPVLFSTKQGLGKSYFNKLLCEPLGELSIERDISVLNDENNSKLFKDMLLINFDEMASQTKESLTNLKSILTKDDIQFREIYTANQITVKKMFCSVGSSNKSLHEILNDTTGSRRLWQVSLIKSIYKTIHSIDFLELYREVDHNKPCELMNDECYTKIMDIQQSTQRKKDIVEYWIEAWNCNINYGDMIEVDIPLNNSTYTSMYLYKHFENWCIINNEKVLSHNKFGRSVKNYLSTVFIKHRTSKFKGYKFITPQ